MDLISGNGRKWKSENGIYKYLTRWSGIVLGKVIHDPKTNTYRVEKMDDKGDFVQISDGHKNIESGAKKLIDTIG